MLERKDRWFSHSSEGVQRGYSQLHTYATALDRDGIRKLSANGPASRYRVDTRVAASGFQAQQYDATLIYSEELTLQVSFEAGQ